MLQAFIRDGQIVIRSVENGVVAESTRHGWRYFPVRSGHENRQANRNQEQKTPTR